MPRLKLHLAQRVLVNGELTGENLCLSSWALLALHAILTVRFKIFDAVWITHVVLSIKSCSRTPVIQHLDLLLLHWLDVANLAD